MKVVILAGGLGSRISEESHLKPKPMIDVGERPILWHIMKIYSHYGFNDFKSILLIIIYIQVILLLIFKTATKHLFIIMYLSHGKLQL